MSTRLNRSGRRPGARLLTVVCLLALAVPAIGLAQPTLDGALDPLYLTKGISTDYVTNIPGITATLHQIDDPAIDPNFIYLVWEIGLGFVDNSYGTRRHSSWPAGHSFFDLAESDLQQLQLINVCGQDVVDATMDYIDGPLGGGPGYGTPSRYDVNMNATESVKNFINGGDWTKFAYKTSIVYNLNQLGFCSGGSCSASPPGDGTNLLVDSPPWADQPNYVPAAPYGGWEYRSLYEMRIDRTVFQTPACVQGTPAAVGADPVQLHASPAKAPTNKLILFRASSTIGDYVWFDADRDGIQDPGEPGIANVTLALYTDPNGDGDFSDGTLVGTTTTGRRGRYVFTRLGKGNYVVDVTDTNNILSGFSLTVGPESKTDPSGPIALPLQEENLDIDFGYAPTDTTTAVVGDYVWSDANQNGLQDAGEPGIGGVALNLVAPGPDQLFGTGDDVVVATTTTDPDGTYLFTGVAAGDYQVVVPPGQPVLSGYTLTTGPQSDTNPGTPFRVAAGDAYLNADFGYFRPGLGTVGNLVWFDVNEDKDFDAGEPGFGNISMALVNDTNGDRVWDPDGLDNVPGTADDELIIATTITALDGSYAFSGLRLDDGGGDGDADYLVFVSDTEPVLGSFLPSIFLPLSTTADGTGKFAPYGLAVSAGTPVNPTGDFGFRLDNPLGLIGDRVWYDSDGDGVQDPFEPGIEGVEVILYIDDNKNGLIDSKKDIVLAVRTTDINGNYFFPRLDFDANGEGYIAVISAKNFGIINGRVDIDADGDVDADDDGSLNGVTVIDGRLDINGSGTITAADDGLWGGATVIDGVLDLDGDGVAGETNGHDSANGALATYKQTGDPEEAGTCTVCDGKSPTVLSNSFTVDLTLDFGYQSIGSFFIGDTVYNDLDADATQDPGEPGIQGVVLGLYEDEDGDGVIDVDEPLVATDTTDVNGNYLFENLIAGDYVVRILDSFGILVGYTQTEGNPTEPVTLGPSTLDVDFGFVRTLPSSISNFVWEDIDGDGIQDAGEPGIANVRVLLYRDVDNDGIAEPGGDDGAAVATVFTAAGGLYSFTTTPGRYFVQVEPPSGFAITLQNTGTIDVDSDPHPVTRTAAVTQLVANENDPTWDAGLYRPVAIGDRVWLDVDADGVQDIGEPGIANVTLELFDPGPDGLPGTADDIPLGTTITDSRGFYLYPGRAPATYFVALDDSTLPAGLTLSGGADPSSQSTLLSGQVVLDKDFGYTSGGGALIGDYVWSDANNNGIQDPGEPGIGGVTLDLVAPGGDGIFGTPDDTVIATRTTAADGTYLFSGVAAGKYAVDVTDTGGVLAGYTLTAGPQSSPDPTAPITVAAGDVYLQADFGYFQAGLGTIGTHLWLDADDDGFRDAGEAGIGGVSIALAQDTDGNGVWDPDGADNLPGTADDEPIVAGTLTAADGSYLFTGLRLDDGGGDGDADYLVVVTDVDGVLAGTTKTVGALLRTNDYSQAVPYPVALATGSANDLTADFGYNRAGAIGDRVWSDADGDGAQDAGEAGIGGVVVELRDGNTLALLDTRTTAADGSYLFAPLLIGDYLVEIAASNFAPGGALDGYTQTGDPDEAGTCSVCDGESATTLAAGESDLTRDFGYRNAALANISGTVFHDTDRDGLHDDPPETGFGAVTMELWHDVDGNGALDPAVDERVAATVTDGAGDYLFADLPDDDYIVAVTDDTGILTGYQLTSGLDQIPVTLAGVDVTDVDFGYVRDPLAGAIGDTVWLDVDPPGPDGPDGLRGPNESGLSGVTLLLYRDLDADGVAEPGGDDGAAIATTVTDANGNYLFGGLGAGRYFVDVDESTLPAGLTTTVGTTDPSAVIGLSQGERFLDADFGYLPSAGSAILGDFVWYDANGDGRQDRGEVGIGGVGVELIGSGPDGQFGTADDVSATTTTGPDGLYLFTGLPPGEYFVFFDPATLPAGYNTTPTNTGPDSTYNVTVVAGDVLTHLDWGFNGGTTGSIGDRVWLDLDADGTQDAGETGIAGVTLNLMGPGPDTLFGTADDVILATTTTDSGDNPNYFFRGLPLDLGYQVVVTDIDGLLDGLNLSSTPPGTLTPTAASPDLDTADFGYAPAKGTGSIGTTVWHDLDGDGFRDTGEPLLQGAVLDLWRDVNGDGAVQVGTDNLVRTTVTDVNGEYEFKALPFGDYLVVTDESGVLGGFTKTSGTAGVDDNSQARPYAVTLSAGSPNEITADFGYRDTVFALNISGTIFVDADVDALFDELIETVVQSVEVRLYRIVGGARVLIARTPSDVNGDYLFSGLPPGDYEVAVVTRATTVDGFLQTTQTTTGGVQPVTLVATDSVDNDFGFYDGGVTTTPVTLSSFEARGDAGWMEFEWSTATEVGTIGFNLWALRDGAWARVNPEIIPASGIDSIELQRYRYEAVGVAGATFLIEDLDIFGTSRFHGPFAANHAYGRDDLRSERIDWPAIRGQHEARTALRRAAPGRSGKPARLGSGASARLLVSEDGIYRVSYEQLAAAGLDLAGVPAPNIAVTSGGSPIPVLVQTHGHFFGPGAYLEFVGTGLDTLYTRTNVYVVRVDPALALRTGLDRSRPKPAASAPRFYRESRRTEHDRQYSFASPNGDPWYDRGVLAFSSPASASFTLETEGRVPGAGPVALTVDLWGVTDWAIDPDHHVVLAVNGVELTDTWFDGLTDHPTTVEVPETALSGDLHTLEVILPGDTGASYDLVNVDGWEISYPRRFLARGGRLEFAAAAEVFEVEGLSSPEVVVYRQTEGSLERLTQVLVSGAPGGYRVRFAGSATPARYLVSGTAAIRVPAVEPNRPAADLDRGPAELLVISHPDFLAAIEPLVQARRSQGWSVKVVDVEDVYTRFGFGVFDPAAIRAYVAFAAAHLETRAVLLVGGDTYDYHDFLGTGGISFIPSLYGSTGDIVRFAPADGLYTDLNGDEVPDLAIGRFPVRTPAELDLLVARTLEYERQSHRRSLLLAADDYDAPSRFDFTQASEQLALLVPSGWSVHRTYLDRLPVPAARADLVARLNEGVAVTSFMGHSGPTSWSFDGLFSARDAAKLENAGRPTVVAQWGCWTTYYVSPRNETLAHKLLLSGDRGAVAVLGATTLTEARSERALSLQVFRRLFAPGTTLGDVVLEAKRALAAAESPAVLDVLVGWNLLGDPTLGLSGPVSPSAE